MTKNETVPLYNLGDCAAEQCRAESGTTGEDTMVLTSKIERQKTEQTARITDLCRQKLLGYAESFQELAKSFDSKFEGSATDRQGLLDERKLWENQKVIYDNLAEVAQIMEKVAKEEFHYRPIESKTEKLLVKILREEGLIGEGLCYLPCENGRQAVGMTLWTMEDKSIPATEVADILSAVFEHPMQLSAVSPYLVERRKHSFLFVEEAKYITLTGFAKVIRENEIISGDNYAFLESEKGKMTILLSDGTGSGEKASRDSGRVLDLMEKMLEAGYGIPASVNLINSALYAKGEDSNHPTLDVCNLDLHGGECRFYKVGGVLSFLKRGKKVEMIEGGSLPLGIFRNMQAECVTRQLQDGDYVILMTDGVLDAFWEDDYKEILMDAVSEMGEQNPGEIAEKLLHLAICSCQGNICDDMTILVAGVWENSSIT